jgi:vitamin B12 transporter
MTRTRRILIASACALAPLDPAFAQEPPDTFRLDQIVVTATRLPAARAAVPAAVTVIRGDDLRARGVRFVADALRAVPGMAVARAGSAGAITSLFLRGGESDYVQVLVDGVRMNEPGGTVDFGQLTTDHIERIEVVRGPVGVLYGSDAVAGVVQIFTRRGEGGPRVRASASAGRASRVGAQADGGYPTTRWDVGVGGGGARGDYSLSFGAYDTDGAYAFNNEYANRTLAARARVVPAERTEASITARYTDGEFHFPTNGAGQLVDRNQFSTTESLALGLEAGHRFSQRVEARLLLALHELERITDDRPDGPADTLGTFRSRNAAGTARRSADARVNVRVGDATMVTVGGEAEHQSGETEFSSMSQFGPFASDTDDERSNLAGYAQLVAAPLQALTVTAGGRAEENDRFGTFTTWRVGANLRAGATLLRAAAGTGFKEPTFFENYAEGFVRGNPSLEPERSRNRELGIEHSLAGGRVTIGATWFDQRFRNLIQFTSQPPSPQDPNYFNIGVAKAAGIELTGSATVLDVAFDAGYTWLDTEVLDEGFGTDRQFLRGRRLLRRPEHSAFLTASRAFGRARIGASLGHVGARDDLDFSDPVEFAGVRVRLPAYTTLDASAEYRVLEGARSLTLSVRAQNALGERYEEIRNFPASGRAVFVGVRAAIGP